MPNHGKQRRTKIAAAGGAKTLISVSALAGTLVGWALLGKQEIVEPEVVKPPISMTDAIVQVLGELPTLITQDETLVRQIVSGDRQQLPGLRTVNAASLSTSRPAAITRTQSSR